MRLNWFLSRNTIFNSHFVSCSLFNCLFSSVCWYIFMWLNYKIMPNSTSIDVKAHNSMENGIESHTVNECLLFRSPTRQVNRPIEIKEGNKQQHPEQKWFIEFPVDFRLSLFKNFVFRTFFTFSACHHLFNIINMINNLRKYHFNDEIVMFLFCFESSGARSMESHKWRR